MTDTLKLKERLIGLTPEICVERARYLTRSFKKTEGQSMIIRRAEALKMILGNITLNIQDGELIVGSATSKELGGGFYPECNSRIWPELDEIANRDTNPFYIDKNDLEELKNDVIPYWSGKTIEDFAQHRWTESLKKRANILGSGMILTEVAGIGHILLNHEKVVKVGLTGILKEIEEYLNRTEKADVQKREFYLAAQISCQAVINFAERYSKKALILAKNELDPNRRKNLEEISGICMKVPSKPAETFWEGVQSIYFLHIVAQIEDYEKSISFGGIDRYLYPLYVNDLNAGRISRERAQTLLECFFIKLNATAPCFDFAGDLAFCSTQSATNLIIGGMDKKGNDVANELSFMAIDARERVCMQEPNFGVRMHRNTDPAFLKRVSQSASSGRGNLQIFNDEIIIPTLRKWGIQPDDASGYGIIGCVELGVPGKTCNSANAALVDFGYCLELALNQGKKLADNLMSFFQGGEPMGPATMDPEKMKSIDDLMDAFKIQLSYQLEKMVEGMEVLAKIHAEHRPLPFISSLTENCLAEGKDILWGGALYNYTAIQGIGMASVGDSLAAIDQAVFKDKKFALKDLLDAMAKNFEGDEALRQALIHKYPKFGNDDPNADRFAKKVVDIFCNDVRRYKTYRGGRYQPGFFSSGGHVAFGMTNAAMPSGRKMGDPLSVGISPAQGMNRSGPTAALNSAARIDYGLITNGAALNLEFSPRFFSGERGIQNFQSLLTTFFDQGGMHLQCNILNKSELLEAKTNPEKYPDLIVRPAGFSIRFIALNPMVQDEIISRTAYQP
ncbi:MAG: formate C-acetyltransferase/glycerol dehydratase family glycyl radical enzyme [Desulfobacterales bacterium]